MIERDHELYVWTTDEDKARRFFGVEETSPVRLVRVAEEREPDPPFVDLVPPPRRLFAVTPKRGA